MKSSFIRIVIRPFACDASGCFALQHAHPSSPPSAPSNLLQKPFQKPPAAGSTRTAAAC
jgi:hypothetical protein